LFIDTGWQFVSQDWQSSIIPTPSPVTRTTWSAFGKQWNLTIPDTSFSKGIDFSKFPPPVSDNASAGFSVASSDDLRSWAEPILMGWGHVFIAAGEYGKGRVIWSGMNLISTSLDSSQNNNYQESSFLSNLLTWLVQGNTTSQSIAYHVQSWESQKLILSINQTAGTYGVFIRQAYFPNWKASLEYAGQFQELNIYQAGPYLTYVPVPIRTNTPMQITIDYESSTLDTISLTISAVTLVVMGLSIFQGGRYADAYIFAPIERTWKRLLRRPQSV
jgi:hypothetical protein